MNFIGKDFSSAKVVAIIVLLLIFLQVKAYSMCENSKF